MKVSTYTISFKNKIRELGFSGRLSDWEKRFISSKQLLSRPSPKQKEIVDKMYIKHIVKRNDYKR